MDNPALWASDVAVKSWHVREPLNQVNYRVGLHCIAVLIRPCLQNSLICWHSLPHRVKRSPWQPSIIWLTRLVSVSFSVSTTLFKCVDHQLALLGGGSPWHGFASTSSLGALEKPIGPARIVPVNWIRWISPPGKDCDNTLIPSRCLILVI